MGAGLEGRGRGFREFLGGSAWCAKVETEPNLRPQRPFFVFLTLSFNFDINFLDATTVEKALPSPATSLGRVDGRRSLDSVLSNTSSVFGGAAAAGGAANNTSLASSPFSSPPGALSSRASLDSARGSADVRALLWRGSMPGKSFWGVCVK